MAHRIHFVSFIVLLTARSPTLFSLCSRLCSCLVTGQVLSSTDTIQLADRASPLLPFSPPICTSSRSPAPCLSSASYLSRFLLVFWRRFLSLQSSSPQTLALVSKPTAGGRRTPPVGERTSTGAFSECCHPSAAVPSPSRYRIPGMPNAALSPHPAQSSAHLPLPAPLFSSTALT